MINFSSSKNNTSFSASRIRLPVKRTEKILNKALLALEKAKTPDEKLKINENIMKFLVKFHNKFTQMNKTVISNKEEKNLLQDLWHERAGHVQIISCKYRDTYEIWKHFHKEHSELVNPFETNPKGYNQLSKQVFKNIVQSMRMFQLFLDEDMTSKKLKPLNMMKMILKSANQDAKKKNIEILVKNSDMLKNITATPKINDYKFYTIFSNLINNAIKYTPENGKIEIDFFKKTTSEKNKFLMLSIKDNGIGIPPEEVDNAIHGDRASNAIESNIAGTGYGLNRVRKICMSFYADPITVKSPVNAHSKDRPGTEITCPIAVINK